MIHKKALALMDAGEMLATNINHAAKVAESTQTSHSGSSAYENADGSYTVIGPVAGDTTVATHVGDTTPPPIPSGIAATSIDGTVTITWDGTLEDAIPADFSHINILLDGSKIAELTAAGSVTTGKLTVGATISITATSEDDACNWDGTPAHNVSGPCAAISVEVRDLIAEGATAAQDAINAVQANLDAAEQDIDTVRTAAAAAQTSANNALAAANQTATDAATGIAEAKSQAQQAITKATANAASITTLTQTTNGLQASVTTAQSTADSAVSAAATAQQDITGFKTTVANTYLSKTDASTTYATQTSLTQTATAIRGEITEVSTAADAAMDKATDVEATASGLTATISQVSTKANTNATNITSLQATAQGLQTSVTTAQTTADSAVTAASTAQQTADTLATTVSTNYLTKDGASSTYATQSSVTQTANSIKTEIASTYLSQDDAADTYATKTALTTTANGINANVTAAATTANTALTKATNLEATADGLSTQISTVAATANGNATAINSLNATATSLQSSITATNGRIDDAAEATSSLEQSFNSYKTTVSTTYQTKADTTTALSGYYTKSEVDQKDSAITSTVTSVATTANNALTKATTVEQTASGLSVKIDANTAKIDGMEIGGTNLFRGSNRSDGTYSTTVGRRYGWWANGTGNSLSTVTLDGEECILISKTAHTTKSIPSATSYNILLEWGKTYMYSCWIRLDKPFKGNAASPLHYHIWAGSTCDNTWGNSVSNDRTGITIERVFPASTYTMPANTWVRYAYKITTAASAPDSTHLYPYLRPFIYGSNDGTATGYQSCWIKGAMVEEGNVATAWQPAPEDAEEGIDSAATAASTAQATADAATNAAMAAAANSADAIAATNAAVAANTNILDSFSVDDLNSVLAQVRVVQEGGVPALQLGSTTSALWAQLTNSQLSFMDASTVVAYVSAMKLFISQAQVTGQLGMGGFAWVPRANGNLCLKAV